MQCIAIGEVTLDHPMTVGYQAFYQCISLTYVNISDSDVYLSDEVFLQDTSLRKVTVTCAVPPQIGSNVFTITNDLEIFVPSESVDVYKSVWYEYANYIKPITN
jgi:hypothetical protein